MVFVDVFFLLSVSITTIIKENNQRNSNIKYSEFFYQSQLSNSSVHRAENPKLEFN